MGVPTTFEESTGDASANSCRKDRPDAPDVVPGDGDARATLVPGAAPAAAGGDGTAAWPNPTAPVARSRGTERLARRTLQRAGRPAAVTVAETARRHRCGYLTSWVVDGLPWCPACWWDNTVPGKQAGVALEQYGSAVLKYAKAVRKAVKAGMWT